MNGLNWILGVAAAGCAAVAMLEMRECDNAREALAIERQMTDSCELQLQRSSVTMREAEQALADCAGED